MDELSKEVENSQSDFLWKQFEMLTALHKFYFEILIKVAMFSLGIVGIILAYLLNGPIASFRHFKFTLTVPILVSLAALVTMGFSCWKAVGLNNELSNLRNELGIKWKLGTDILITVSLILALFFFVLLVCLMLLFNDPSSWA